MKLANLFKTMNLVSVFHCDACGAVASDFAMAMARARARLSTGNNNLDSALFDLYNGYSRLECPFCNGTEKSWRTGKIKQIHDSFINYSEGNIMVSAVYVDCNGISNPRLVISFADNPFNTYETEFPAGFVLSKPSTSYAERYPVDLVYNFNQDIMQNANIFLDKLLYAADSLISWIKRYTNGDLNDNGSE